MSHPEDSPAITITPLGDDATAHQVLDLNAIEERGLLGGAAITLGSMKLSADQRMLACTMDLEGNDRFVLAVFELDEPGAAVISREDVM